MITTGTVFQATDKSEKKYVYEFNGINLDDNTGCHYIHLHNLTLDQYTDVEYAWFGEHKIKILHNGITVKSGKQKGTVIKLHAGISNNNLKVLPDGKFTWEGTEIWSWSDTEIYD